MIELIEKKRDGHTLTQSEIAYIVSGVTDGSIPDYQLSAWAMAVYFQGLNADELAWLTMAMVASGEQIDLQAIDGIKVDKHSTGGVGDTTTLILAPLVASVGVPVAKMSGRGLGHTGGTIDKLESIAGFHVEVSQTEFVDLVNRNKVAVVGQSGNLTPADKKLYALRDVTGTVASIPLIASSIMSKKIAAGADAIVLDVKVGTGAFMKGMKDARQLAETMVAIGHRVNRQTVAVISDMNQPLGYAIGNALEVAEAIHTLRGNGPEDLVELCLTLGSHMAHLGGVGAHLAEARALLAENLANGRALAVFKQFIAAQGGDVRVVDDVSLLPQAAHQIDVLATDTGYITHIEADAIGVAAMLLGAGRATKESAIDLAVGIQLLKKVGDAVTESEPIAIIHSNRPAVDDVVAKIQTAYQYGAQPQKTPLIHEVIGDIR